MKSSENLVSLHQRMKWQKSRHRTPLSIDLNIQIGKGQLAARCFLPEVVSNPRNGGTRNGVTAEREMA